MSNPPKSAPHPDPLTEDFIQQALAKFQGKVSAEDMATLHEILSDAADNHPMAQAILKQLRSRPGVDKSGDVPTGALMPDRERGGKGSAEGA